VAYFLGHPVDTPFIASRNSVTDTGR